MLSYICNNGRLGENISFIYGLFKFCKNNGIDYKNIILDVNYKNISLLKNKKPHYVFKENMEMFSNIKYIFKNIKNNYFKDFIIDDIESKTDIAKLYNYFEYNNFDKNENIIFKDWWSLDDYFMSRCVDFDYQLLDYICRPKKVVNKLAYKYRKIFLKNTIAIHIRREDYLGIIYKNILKHDVSFNAQNYFKNKTIYSVKEIDDIINENLSNDNNIMIFSDDTQWCKQNFQKYNSVHIIEGNKPYEDMITMSLCNKVIKNPGSFFSQIPYILSGGYKKCF